MKKHLTSNVSSLIPQITMANWTPAAQLFPLLHWILQKVISRTDLLRSSTNNKPFAIEIAFATNHVEKVYNKAIKTGATPVSEAEEKPHGQTVAYVKDIDGFLIEICTPMTD